MVLIITLLTCRFCMANDYDQSKANSLVKEFITQLRQNKPFSYEDEIKYFGELTLHSYMILQSLEYVDKSGQWLKEKPKYSYLCELIRLNSDLILMESPQSEYYFSNIYQIPKENHFINSDLYAMIAYVQHKTPPLETKGEPAMIALFTYNIPHNKISFPVFINGLSFFSKIGFEIESFKDPLPRFNESAKKKLISHMKQLVNTRSGTVPQIGDRP